MVYAKLFKLYKKYADFIDRVSFWGVDECQQLAQRTKTPPVDADRNPKKLTGPQLIRGVSGIGQRGTVLTSFAYDGEEFECLGYEFDVNVPESVSKINLLRECFSQLRRWELTSPSVFPPWQGSGRQTCSRPLNCLADTPESFNEYKITSAIDGRMGFRILIIRIRIPLHRQVRFSDGKRSRLEQLFLDEDGEVDQIVTREFEPLPRHTVGTISVSTENQLNDDYLSAEV
jgi:hypothetical protein